MSHWIGTLICKETPRPSHSTERAGCTSSRCPIGLNPTRTHSIYIHIRWVSEAKQNGLDLSDRSIQYSSGMGAPGVFVVAGNKVDQPDGRRQVSESEARAWAQDNGGTYFETSAKSGANVTEIFEFMFRRCANDMPAKRCVGFSSFAGKVPFWTGLYSMSCWGG